MKCLFYCELHLLQYSFAVQLSKLKNFQYIRTNEIHNDKYLNPAKKLKNMMIVSYSQCNLAVNPDFLSHPIPTPASHLSMCHKPSCIACKVLLNSVEIIITLMNWLIYSA